MEKSVAMRDQSIGSLLWKFSLPAIVGMLVNALYNIVDRISALISIRLGQQKKEEAERVADNATVMLIILPVIIAVIYLLFPESILIFFGASKEVLPYARDFVHIIMMGAAFGSISMGMNNFIRAEGNPRLAMFSQVTGALINGVLNYVFIFKLGLGIKGSALATVSGQFFQRSGY